MRVRAGQVDHPEQRAEQRPRLPAECEVGSGAGVAAAGALIALAWLPAQPTTRPVDGAEAGVIRTRTGTPAFDQSQ